MLDSQTKRKIDAARDILVGVVPVPQSQVEQITIALIYKFMDDMDNEAIELGGKPSYFTGDYAKYAWSKLFDPKLSGEGRVLLYQDALARIPHNNLIPTLFRDIFRNAYLPYRSAETLRLFLKCINDFSYDHSEKLGDAFEYLLAVLGSQGDAGQFRTPRHIIDFMVELIDPQKEESILDPACGTAGFLISAYKHIIKTNSSNYDKDHDPHTFESHGIPLSQLVLQNVKRYSGDLLTPDQRVFIHKSIKGYDISPEMVRLSLVNMYLHGFNTPEIFSYDTLTQDERWYEYFNVILANPPFMTPKGGIRPHQKFTIKAKRSEVLFVDYIMEHLTNNGKAGIVVPEGIIFKSENAYKQLRKSLVEDNYLVGVISLPGGVFNPYSGVKTSILWIDKALAKKTDKIIFLKINNDGFDLGAQRRPCDANDLPAAFANAQAFKKAILSGKEYNVPESDVIVVEKKRLAESGDYNLSGERYTIQVSISPSISMIKLGEIIKAVGTIDPRKFSEDMFELWSIPAYDKGKPDVLNGRDIGSQKKAVSPGDVLLSRIVPHIRRAWDVEPCISGLKQVASTEWIVFSSDRIIPGYLSRVLVSDHFHKQFLMTITGVGGSLSRASIEAVKSIEVPLPPLPVQKEIVAELDSYQKIIDGAKQVVDNWKPHIDIDPEWERVKLGEVCINVLSGGTPSSKISEYWEGDIPWISSADIVDYNSAIPRRFITQSAIKKSATNQIPKDNVIVVTRVGLGKLFYNSFDVCISQDSQGLIIDKKIANPKYVLYSLIDKVASFKNSSQGTTIQGVTKKQLTELLLSLPSLNIQISLVERIEAEQKLVDANRELINLYEQKIKDRIDRLWK